MRKIERDMLKHIWKASLNPEYSWGSANTGVYSTPADRIGGKWSVLVRLHGNMIATLNFYQSGAPYIELNLCGWNTPTTRSRINAILVEFGSGRVYQKDFAPRYAGPRGDHAVPDSGWFLPDPLAAIVAA